jgi:predicted Fe-S protein YdhL (DUF1289 family)
MIDFGDEVWKRDEIESPCVKVCVLHPGAKLCMGCFRTGDEIARWSRMDPAERKAIMADLAAREPLITKAAPIMRPGKRTNRRFAKRNQE